MTFTHRLVVDVVRRQWMTYAFAFGLIVLQRWLMRSAAADGVVLKSPPDVLEWSLTATWLLAFMPAMASEGREILQLPVSRREMWLVRWWLAVLVPAVLLSLASGEARLLLFCSLYGGCYTAFAAILPIVPSTEPGAMRRVMIRFICIPLGGAAAPFWFAKYLPQRAGELDAPVLWFVIAAAGIAAASYTFRPPIVERPSPRKLQTNSPARQADQGVPKSRLLDYLPGNLLTGLPRLFWIHAREIAVVAPFAFLMIWFIEASTDGGSSNSTRHLLHRLQLMPFDIDYAFDGRRGFNVMIWVFIGMGFKIREVMQRARVLRTLPMTANTLALVFSGLSVTTAAVIWMWLLAIHRLVAGGLPSTLRLDIFVIFSGALMLMRAMELAIPSKFAGQLAGIIIFVPLVFAATFVLESPNAGMIASGLACVVTGTFLQAWLLRRRHAIYQFKPPTLFGKPIPS